MSDIFMPKLPIKTSQEFIKESVLSQDKKSSRVKSDPGLRQGRLGQQMTQELKSRRALRA
jgi:hypothetical protein